MSRKMDKGEVCLKLETSKAVLADFMYRSFILAVAPCSLVFEVVQLQSSYQGFILNDCASSNMFRQLNGMLTRYRHGVKMIVMTGMLTRCQHEEETYFLVQIDRLQIRVTPLRIIVQYGINAGGLFTDLGL